MISRSHLASKRMRVLIGAVALFTAVGVAAFPRIAQAAGVVNVTSVPDAAEGLTGLSPVKVKFQLSEANASEVRVNYTTQDGPDPKATAGADYVFQEGTVVFPAGTLTQEVTFNIKGDGSDEPNEMFSVVLTGTPTGGVAKGTNGTVTITDDDSAPSVFLDDASLAENSPTGKMKFKLRFSAPTGQPTKVRLNTQAARAGNEVPQPITPPQATAPGDFTALVNTDISIPTGTSSMDVEVTINNDLRDEYDEKFEVQLSDAPGGNLGVPTDYGTGTILDDDAPPIIDIVGASTPEGTNKTDCDPSPLPFTGCNKVTFTVTVTPPSDKVIRVNFAHSPRSATTSDYRTNGGTGEYDQVPTEDTALYWAPAGFQQDEFRPDPKLPHEAHTVTMAVLDDASAEPDERFAMVLSNPLNATLGNAEAFAVITNDDGGAFPSVVVNDAPDSTEGTTANAAFTITATWPPGVPPPNTNAVNVNYTTADGPDPANPGCGGAAVKSKDYTATSGSVTLNFAVNSQGVYTATSPPQNVPILNDAVNEGVECFQLQITDAGNAEVPDPIGQAKINDDDPRPKLTIADKAHTEGTGGTSTAPLTVTLDKASGQTVSVGYETPQPNAGTAKVSDDYTNSQGTISFLPGETSKTINIPINPDSIDENNETVDVVLKDPSGADIADGAAVLTITDDDNPPSVSIFDTRVTEGSTGTVTATFDLRLSAPSGKSITVKATTSDGTAKQPGDYGSKSETITFAPGTGTDSTPGEFKVSVVSDTIDEADEAFNVTLSEPNANVTVGDPSAVGTIEDDDTGPSVSVADASGTENSGKVTFTLTLSQSSGQDTKVKVKTTNGTAAAPADFNAVADTTEVTIPAGQTTKTFDVTVVNDTIDESDETFTFTLVSSAQATIDDGEATGTIVDDDTPASNRRITTGPGPGGGPHIRTFGSDGNAAATEFFDGSDTTGKRVAMGDLNGDGADEIITGSGANSAGVVSVYGAAGNLIASSFAYNNGNWFGGIFVAAADVDGDGKAELITGVGPGGGPHVKVWKLVGSSLVEIAGFYAYTNAQGQPNWNGGVTVAGGDLNGDGKAEIVTGVGAGGGPHVKAFGVTVANTVMSFAELFGFYAYTTPTGQPNWNGGVNVAVGDLDDDGKAEIATTPWSGGGPHLRLFNRDGSLRHGGIFASTNPSFNGGLTVAMGDLDGDGNAEVAVASMTQTAGVRTYKADLSGFGTNFTAYPNFGGGLWIALGRA